MDRKAVAAIGIDLGTTYSCVGVWQNDQVEIISNDQGNRTMPSCVAFTNCGRLIGEGAKNQTAMNPTNTIYDAKRLIGRRFNDAKLQEDIKLWPFKVIKGTSNIPKIVVSYNGEEKEFSAEEISSMVLIKLKEAAEKFLGNVVRDAVITVPAYFDDSQRQATKDAGHVAGLNVLQIINEPTSAAIAYGLDMRNNITRQINVLIFDLGGGTFDVSLVTIDKNSTITVKAVAGDTHLGGQDFDSTMVDYFVEQFKRKHKIDISVNKKALSRLRVACEKAKRVLSSIIDTIIDIDSLHDGVDFSMRISRAKFEKLNEDFFSKCIEMVEKCLGDAQMNKKDIDEVVLVGGSTRIPKVQQMLTDFFQGKELSKKIHADEAVAYGATVLAGKLTGCTGKRVKNLVLIDVVPLSLGTDLYDGSMSVIIKRNSPIPIKNEKTYVTVEDDQEIIGCNIYQGERSRAVDNNWLGKFNVAVPPAPKRKSKIRVTFSVDANGILNCSGVELTTGLKRGLIVTNYKERLTTQDIEKMLDDAHKYKLQDEEYKKKTFVRNALEGYIDDVKSKIKKIGNNTKMIHKKDMEIMEIAIEKASKILNESQLDDFDEYEKALNQLEKVCLPIIAKLV
ncbi:heat shock cognate 70 kDa protein [Lactuca sativa]|uniref:Heat shock protein 70 n=1 Tax=Lactuca sativa TaxID=4236 RepID=A0A9R1XX94_LACSA|nr:heat shock cognate 70 kDa protein [Lactuca sativa]XP_023745421.1 heat shock cognate 70 kDa protein [Lactuca sativa]KAJ0226684.1 hypothetical protein LSAT_V11C100037050 [Lactuca sativa]